MKELSIEEKAKAYDKVRDKIAIRFGSNVAKEIFSEYEESEDEKIRKEIIHYLEINRNQMTPYQELDCINRWLPWLEKQGKNNMGISEATKKKLEDNLNKALEKETPESWNEFLEKQGGQKPTDKIEPKFKVGDWVTNGIDVDKIIGIDLEDKNYLFKNGGKSDISLVESISHIWTIQDAKDGDVLCCESGWTCIFKTLVNDETFSSYCFMDNTKWFCETGSECHTLNKEFTKAYNGEIKPATKEQCDTFEKAMADAGYTFNFEKKELKKIEQKPAELGENKSKELSLSLQIQAYLNTASDELYAKGKPLYSKERIEDIHKCMLMWQKLHNAYFYPDDL